MNPADIGDILRARGVPADIADEVVDLYALVERERDDYRGLLIELRRAVGPALQQKIDEVL